MNTLVQRMTHIRWRVMLALERYANKVAFEARYPARWQLNMKDGGRYDRLVDRLSPFSPLVGYKRRRLRRTMYWLRYPRTHIVDWYIKFADARLVGWSRSPGRYEGNDSQLIARWLDEHSEYADAEIGDTSEYGVFFATFSGEFPWSDDAHYITSMDDQGFFSVSTYDTFDEAMVRWRGIQQQYEFWLNNYEDAG